MKTKYILFLLSFLLLVVQMLEAKDSTRYTSTRSHVVKKIYLDPTSTVTGARTVINVTYMDGLGRPLQEIGFGASPAGGDLIIPHVYGQQGKEEKQYLPYRKAGNDGMLDATPLSASNWSYLGSTEQGYAFTRVDHDGSPLKRVMKSTGPGRAWHDGEKGVTMAYQANAANQVKKWRVDDSGQLLGGGEYYAANTLSRVIATSEDGDVMEEFRNTDDQVLLSVAVNGSERLATYMIYDDFGRPRYVLSPEASSRVGTSATRTTEAIARYAYYYEYDKYSRQVLKQLPGCDPVYMVYDNRDRLVMSQDGKQRAENANKWSYVLYDNLNREVELGEVILSTAMTHAALQAVASASNNYVPAGTRTALRYTVYDNYAAMNGVSSLAFVPVAGYASIYSTLTTGLTTSTRTRVLGTGTWLTTTTYYDDRCRIIQTVSDNIQGGTSRVSMKYDFPGNLVQQQESHRVGTMTSVLEAVNSYDSRGRLLSSTTRLNNGAPATVSCAYDAVGRLVTKTRGTLTETMTYNTRGWLTGKESVPFKMKLRYEAPQGGGLACYGGNVSEWEWQQGTNTSLLYGFTYDKLNRLQETVQKQKSGTAWINFGSNHVEKGIAYDLNGNIKTMVRTAGGAVVDNLVYSYTGNQLTGLSENIRTTPTGDIYLPGSTPAGTYTYDRNGNLINDTRKALNFTYNVLNLLSEVKTGSTVKAKYDYLADGVKLRVRDGGEATGFDYLGSLTYKKSSAGLQLETANFGEGIIRVTGSGAAQQEVNYFLTDHLGSVRVIVGSNGSILERNDYYPFGARHVKSDYPKSDNRLLYNGKEEQATGNLEYLDYGARMYDSGLGRWFGGDPLSEKYLSLSPYVYGANNPVRYIDPDGRKIKDPNDLVKNYKKQVISNRYALQHMMKTGAVDAETGEKLMSFYKNILHEISTLEKSSQVYTVLLNTSSTEGGINYDMSTGEIRIEIGDNSIGLTGHELNHAYQYENGEISFVVNNSKYGQLYDISDETNAYNRERALGTGMQFFQMPNVIYNGYPFKMENNDVRDLGKSMTPPAYQTLPNGPIDINSKEGKALRERTRQTGSLGDSVYEVYKGWQKDYRKKRKK